MPGAWRLDLPLPFSWHLKPELKSCAPICLVPFSPGRQTVLQHNSHLSRQKEEESPRRPPCPRRQRIRRSAVRLERAHQVEPSRRNCRFRRRRRRARGRLRRVNVRRGQRRGEQLSPPFLRLFLQLALRWQVIVTAAASLNAGEADDAVPRRRRRTPGERRGKELRRQAPDAVAAERSLQTGAAPARRASLRRSSLRAVQHCARLAGCLLLVHSEKPHVPRQRFAQRSSVARAPRRSNTPVTRPWQAKARRRAASVTVTH